MTWIALGVFAALLGGVFALYWITVEPGPFSPKPSTRSIDPIDPARLAFHVQAIARECRDFQHPEGLRAVLGYLTSELRGMGLRPQEQSFEVEGVEFRNLTVELGPSSGPRIVVGAHYDTCGPLPGADDNASGVAGLIEIARALRNVELPVPVELVAYCLEEPPFFRTQAMGSAVHAQSLYERGERVRLMISIEMIGFFSERPRSQTYPARYLSWIYPRRANFIAVVGTFGQGAVAQQTRRAMAAACTVPVISITASRRIAGIDFSDHQSYWDRGYPALMVTDTSLYRNPNYHTAEDTPETLDYPRMAQVVRGLVHAIIDTAHRT